MTYVYTVYISVLSLYAVWYTYLRARLEAFVKNKIVEAQTFLLIVDQGTSQPP